MTLCRPEPARLPDDSLTSLRFAGSSGRLLLPRADDLAKALSNCLLGWDCETAPAGDDTPLLAAAARTGRGIPRYAVSSRYTDRPSGGLPQASAVCSLIADLSQDWAESAPDILGLHAAAVGFGGGLVVITGPSRAGKSTLATRLALEPGADFFCDDVLPVDRLAHGVALGIAPRLRLPVPIGSPALARLVRDRKLLSDDRYVYVDPPQRAPHGARLPLRAILIPERREGATASFYHIDRGEALSMLLRQSLTSFPTAELAFDHATAVVAGLPVARLVYSDLDEAAALVCDQLGPTRTPDFSDLPTIPALVPELPQDQPPPSTTVFTRHPDVILRRVGKLSWLWLPGDGMLWEMNRVSLAIWAMLEFPGNAGDLASALAEVFADIPPTQLAADVGAVLESMEQAGLILPQIDAGKAAKS